MYMLRIISHSQRKAHTQSSLYPPRHVRQLNGVDIIYIYVCRYKIPIFNEAIKITSRALTKSKKKVVQREDSHIQQQQKRKQLQER